MGINGTDYMCAMCNQCFSRSDSLVRHQKKYCKAKLQEDAMAKNGPDYELRNKVKHLEEVIVELTRQIKQTKNDDRSNSENNQVLNTNMNHSNIGNNNQNINNTININLNAFGKEDNSHLTESDYKFMLNKGFKSIQELVKQVHFNEKKPENHNVYISNLRENYATIYNGNQWIVKSKHDVLDDLYSTKKELLQDKYDEIIEKLPDYTKEKFGRFIYEEQEKSIQKKIKDEMKFILYNKKSIPIGTRSKYSK